MHYKRRRYKICSRSVVLREATQVFSKLQGPQYYLPENFRCNFKFYESENFSDSSVHRIFESEDLRFPFSSESRLTWGLECKNLNFRKS